MSQPADTALVPAAGARAPARPAGKPVPPLPSDLLPSSIEKAAILLTAIGPEMASGFLEGLSETDMERFARALSRLGKVRQEVLDAVIAEFLTLLTTGPEVAGGSKAARELLAGLIDDEEIERILSGRAAGDQRSVWDRLNDVPVKALAGFLQAEHPQTVAVILTEMRPEIAAAVLEQLDRDFAQAIVLRLSRVPSVDRVVARSIEAAIERDFLLVLKSNLSKRRPADLIAGLLNNISSETRDGFLGFLEQQDEHLARAVQRIMFTFEDIHSRLQGRDVAGVLREVEEVDILKALKFGEAQGSPTVAFIIENLPRRLAERYVEEMAALDEITAREGEAAQIELTKVIQTQAKAGLIQLIEREAAGA